MIHTNSNANETLKEKRKRDAAELEAKIKTNCEALAIDLIGENELKQLSNTNKGLWYMPILNEDNSIECMAIMRPIDRTTLSFASTKIEDEGLYTFLEQCMRDVFVAGIQPDKTVVTKPDESVIITDDEYFIPSAMRFNKIMENKKAAFLKR